MSSLRENIVIRSATEQDAQQIITFLKKVGDETQNLTFDSSDFEISVEDEAAFLSRNEKDGTFIVAEYRGLIIGTSQLIISTRERIKRTSDMSISVLKEYWGTGVSSLLMKKIIERATSLNIKKINLLVRTDNIRARKFYEKYHFIKEGETSRMFYIDQSWISGTFYGLEL